MIEHARARAIAAQYDAPARGGRRGPARRRALAFAHASRRRRGRCVAALTGGALAQLEGRHRSAGGNALRAAVLGANDGLVSNLSLVMGVAGADSRAARVLVTGLAGLLAGACSMAMGEWLSVNSARELYAAADRRSKPTSSQRNARGRAGGARADLSGEGLAEPTGEQLADAHHRRPRTPRSTRWRARSSASIPTISAARPGSRRGTSFLLFAVGAIFPVAPFFFLSGSAAIVASLGVSASRCS